MGGSRGATPLIAALVLVGIAASPSQASERPACPQLAPARGESYASFQARAHRQNCLKPWTILVYMAADNDLAPYAFWDLYEMEAGYRSGRLAAGSTARADLLVQLELLGREEASRLHVFQSTGVADVYDDKLTIDDFRHRDESQIRSPVAERVSRSEDGKPVPAAADFERFIQWGVRNYPAQHYMVVVWGHGQGWAPSQGSPGAGFFSQSDGKAAPFLATDFTGRHFGGLAFSDSEHTFLDIPSLHHALQDVQTGLLDGHPIDVYASDACLMQMVEVATEISDSVRFISGSSQVENYLGLPYRRMMFELNTGRFSGERARPGVAGSDLARDEPYLLARMLPRLFRMSLEEHGLHGRVQPHAIETVTMSSLSSDELRGSLVPALGELGRALGRYLDEDPLRAIGLQQVLQDAPSFMGGSQELGGFLTLLRKRLREEAISATGDANAPLTGPALALAAAIDSAAQALDRTVVSYALGTRYTGAEPQLYLLGFRALALWLPVSAQDYKQRIGDFTSSLFYREQGDAWTRWLGQLYGNNN